MKKRYKDIEDEDKDIGKSYIHNREIPIYTHTGVYPTQRVRPLPFDLSAEASA
jgi:hypothetical protein